MRPPYSTLTPTHIYTYAATLLEPYWQWHEYGTAMVEVLRRLLHLLHRAGIRPRLLLLDRGFGSRAVIRKTSTRDPTLRLLFIGIALILRNIRVWIHYQLLATPCHGGRTLNLGRLPFKTLLLRLTYLAVQTFGIVDSVALAQAL
jgi:hypothetical protein